MLAFKDCTSLTGITLRKSLLCIVLGAFSHCSSLKDITLPEGVNIDMPDGVTHIDEDAFTGSLVVVIAEAGGFVEGFCDDHDIPFYERN